MIFLSQTESTPKHFLEKKSTGYKQNFAATHLLGMQE
jgi:hypothetical protein